MGLSLNIDDVKENLYGGMPNNARQSDVLQSLSERTRLIQIYERIPYSLIEPKQAGGVWSVHTYGWFPTWTIRQENEVNGSNYPNNERGADQLARNLIRFIKLQQIPPFSGLESIV